MSSNPMDYIQLLFQSKLLRVATLVSIAYLFLPTIKKFYAFFWRIQYFLSFPKCEGNFFLGNLKQLISSVSDFVIEKCQNFPNESFVAIWLGWYPLIACIDHQSAEAVLSQPNLNKGESYKFLGLKDGLITSHGPKWKARRRMIEPFFTTKNLSNYILAMKESYDKMIRDMSDKNIQSIDMADYIHKTSFDIILETTMSVPIESEQQKKGQIINDLETVEKTIVSRIRNPILWPDWYFCRTKMGKIFKSFTDGLDRFIETRIKERLDQKSIIESYEKKKKDFIDLLLNYYDPNTTDVTSTIDMEGIVEEILTLIMAGHDSIATVLRWTLFLLGNNPECQAKIYDEIIKIIEENDNLPDLANINRLTYMEQCIKETMRLYPPVPLIQRKLEFDSAVGKYVVPEGSDIIFSYYNIHRDRRVWENPDVFDPDRFSPERFSKIPKYAYLPFGQGKRICLGQRFAMIEMKLFLFHLMRSYSFVSIQSVDQVKFDMDVTLKPKTPLTIKLTPRS